MLLESEHDHPENLNAPAAVKQLVAVIGAAAEVIDLEEVSAFKEEAPVTITADTGDSPAPITCRPFMMKYSTDSRAEIRVDLGTHSCTDMRCCAADGCCTLVCMTHGFGEGFEEPYNDDAGFPSRVCQQNGCDVVFCERHFGRMMSECDSCRNISSAEMELEGSGIHLELAKSFFCPSHATVRCNLRYRFDGDKLDEKEAYRERKTVAKDMEYAEQGDAVLGSMGLSADCLFQEIAAKKSKREANDDRRGIGHCSFMLCQECVADKWHRHRCCDDPDDFNTLF